MDNIWHALYPWTAWTSIYYNILTYTTATKYLLVHTGIYFVYLGIYDCIPHPGTSSGTFSGTFFSGLILFLKWNAIVFLERCTFCRKQCYSRSSYIRKQDCFIIVSWLSSGSQLSKGLEINQLFWDINPFQNPIENGVLNYWRPHQFGLAFQL